LRNNKLRLLGDLSGFVFESENKLSIDNTTDLSEYL
jgi:hypothetical protein